MTDKPLSEGLRSSPASPLEQPHCENCGAVGVELQELICRSCWEHDADGPAFHWRDGVYFQRLNLGAVLMTLPGVWKMIPENEWASIVQHVGRAEVSSPARPTLQKIREHLSAVEGSPDWADLTEILDWYKRDVETLLALAEVSSAPPPALEELIAKWRVKADEKLNPGGGLFKHSERTIATLRSCADELEAALASSSSQEPQDR